MANYYHKIFDNFKTTWTEEEEKHEKKKERRQSNISGSPPKIYMVIQ